ncbi:hypothetical protein LSH36_154g01006 [Paralvinella palmiformis]|uniref:Uncharacterized protein n=1 Tax=Paralvinella palmiformis TaxID=53620 RepID=A0AAD9N764_9ANNE|nr:hypothetical protein LSH36_154g01006 [Paralvinella palmiformis]
MPKKLATSSVRTKAVDGRSLLATMDPSSRPRLGLSDHSRAPGGTRITLRANQKMANTNKSEKAVISQSMLAYSEKMKQISHTKDVISNIQLRGVEYDKKRVGELPAAIRRIRRRNGNNPIGSGDGSSNSAIPAGHVIQWQAADRQVGKTIIRSISDPLTRVPYVPEQRRFGIGSNLARRNRIKGETNVLSLNGESADDRQWRDTCPDRDNRDYISITGQLAKIHKPVIDWQHDYLPYQHGRVPLLTVIRTPIPSATTNTDSTLYATDDDFGSVDITDFEQRTVQEPMSTSADSHTKSGKHRSNSVGVSAPSADPVKDPEANERQPIRSDLRPNKRLQEVQELTPPDTKMTPIEDIYLDLERDKQTDCSDSRNKGSDPGSLQSAQSVNGSGTKEKKKFVLPEISTKTKRSKKVHPSKNRIRRKHSNPNLSARIDLVTQNSSTSDPLDWAGHVNIGNVKATPAGAVSPEKPSSATRTSLTETSGNGAFCVAAERKLGSRASGGAMETSQEVNTGNERNRKSKRLSSTSPPKRSDNSGEDDGITDIVDEKSSPIIGERAQCIPGKSRETAIDRDIDPEQTDQTVGQTTDQTAQQDVMASTGEMSLNSNLTQEQVVDDEEHDNVEINEDDHKTRDSPGRGDVSDKGPETTVMGSKKPTDTIPGVSVQQAHLRLFGQKIDEHDIRRRLDKNKPLTVSIRRKIDPDSRVRDSCPDGLEGGAGLSEKQKGKSKKKCVQFGPDMIREVTKIQYPWNVQASSDDEDDDSEPEDRRRSGGSDDSDDDTGEIDGCHRDDSDDDDGDEEDDDDDGGSEEEESCEEEDDSGSA